MQRNEEGQRASPPYLQSIIPQAASSGKGTAHESVRKDLLACSETSNLLVIACHVADRTYHVASSRDRQASVEDVVKLPTNASDPPSPLSPKVDGGCSRPGRYVGSDEDDASISLGLCRENDMIGQWKWTVTQETAME